MIDANGSLYGQSGGGGPGAPAACGPSTGCGEVFRLSRRPNGTYAKTVLWAFNGLDGTAGSNALVADYAGNLYGLTTKAVRPTRCARKTPASAPPRAVASPTNCPPLPTAPTPGPTTRSGISSLGSDSGYPFNATITIANGRYFTTSSGPYPLTDSYGAVVEFLPPAKFGPWTEKTLYTFNNTLPNEAQPESSLFFTGSALFGTATGYDTAGSYGTVFRITPLTHRRSAKNRQSAKIDSQIDADTNARIDVGPTPGRPNSPGRLPKAPPAPCGPMSSPFALTHGAACCAASARIRVRSAGASSSASRADSAAALPTGPVRTTSPSTQSAGAACAWSASAPRRQHHPLRLQPGRIHQPQPGSAPAPPPACVCRPATPGSGPQSARPAPSSSAARHESPPHPRPAPSTSSTIPHRRPSSAGSSTTGASAPAACW